jgi:putative DNA primase/helicase
VNWENYDDVMAQMRADGLAIDSLEVGRMVRCRVDDDREKRGWYSLHELRLDSGAYVLVGSFGVWRGADNNAQKIELKKRQLNDDQRRALKARIDSDRKAAAAERDRSAARAAARAQRAWEQCTEQGHCEYLTRKGVGAHGVRFSGRGNMVLPMLDVQGRVHGLQVIYAKKKHGRDKDYWPAGMSKQGHFFLLGPLPGPGAVVLVAEGYATAASLFEATGFTAAVAFDAGNLLPVAQALSKRYRRARILVCADDDYLTDGNPGVSRASAAALAVEGDWIAPEFARDREGKKITDFNDLHAREGLHAVRAQVEARVRRLGWDVAPPPTQQGGRGSRGGGNDGDDGALRPIEHVDELHQRFALVYEMPETVFDAQEHKLVPLSSMRNVCTSRMVHRQWMESREKRIVRQSEVGFDPAGEDPQIKCNLWGGWPTVPKAGECARLLELLRYLCSEERDGGKLYDWVLQWLAYPLQHPGAKMKTALVLHGPSGAGKNAFFDAYAGIYGEYGRMIGQAAVEDKFNDWASRKLFLVANEVVSRSEVYHVKNALKSLITDDWVRINPKNVGAHDERNHVNLVFLSNEFMPVALERDDRRYAIIWTPAKKDFDYYAAVRAEIAAGGIAALHDYLLQLDLAGFDAGTLPPMTAAKQDLIELGMDSTERFYEEWVRHYLPLPIAPARSEDLFDAYKHWCMRGGVHKAAQLSTFLGNTAKRPGAAKRRKRHFVGGSDVAEEQSMCIFPPGSDPDGISKADLTYHVDNFADSVERWKQTYTSRFGSKSDDSRPPKVA